ncbi:forkhead box protein fkh-2-like [Rhopilema esculentum]|uniref:forkhead box protein fkh-2-like n=1 Tax=Rhopilema esculentum TaxID=499914 RepID=UPI0031CEFE5D|eukprot:gene350-10013_t
MINPMYSKREDSLGHKYMTSYVRQTPSKNNSSKFLPLSIENILGRVESNERDEDSGSEVEINKNDEKIDQTEDDIEVDIEGEEANKIESEKAKQDTQGEPSTDKQSPSYTAIIAQAILSSPDKKLPLGSIYEYIAEHFPEFLKKGQGWRNCVRHNLSLSECFVKAGRARNGRGNYWGIHPRYLKNFSKGDFRKRRASHRPRNRDLGIGLGADRLHYSHFLNPFIYPTTHRVPTDERSFSVESLLSPERREHYDRHSAFNSYKSRTVKSEAHRIPGIYCPLGTSWLEHKPYSENTYHPYSVREPQQPVCSCHLYCCTRA